MGMGLAATQIPVHAEESTNDIYNYPDVQEAQQEVEVAQLQVENAQAQLNTANNEASEASATVNHAQDAVNQKQSEIDSLNKEIQTKQEELNSASSTNNPEYNKGVAGFYASLGDVDSQSAIGILNQYKNATYNGNSIWQEDITQRSTDLENVKAALEMIDAVNQKRATDNNPNFTNHEPFTISSLAMAHAQIRAQYVYNNYVFNNGKLGHPDSATTISFLNAENLAYTWGYGTRVYPVHIEGWYDDEKALYEQYGSSKINPNPQGKSTGHYEAIMGNYQMTGAALTQTLVEKYGIMEIASQAFQRQDHSQFDGYAKYSYTFEQYYELFMDYYRSVTTNSQAEALEKEIAALNGQLQSKQNQYDSLLSQLNLAQSVLKGKQEKVLQAKNQLDNAQQNLEQKEENLRSVIDSYKTRSIIYLNEDDSIFSTFENVVTKVGIPTPETNPTKEYYTFTGWERIQEDETQITFKAQFVVNPATIVYTYENLETWQSIPTFEYVLASGQLPAPTGYPTKENYTFTGWEKVGSRPDLITFRPTYEPNKYSKVVNGKMTFYVGNNVDTSINGTKTVNGKNYYIVNGEQSSFTGLIPVDNTYKFIRNGIFENFTGISKSKTNDRWYFSRNGIIDWNFTGVAKSVADGNWYHCYKGQLDWAFTGISQSVADGNWYFSRKGKLDWSFTGIAKSIANNQWYFVRKGKVDWAFTGVAQSVANGKWYFSRKGKLDWSFTGVAKSVENGKWYFVRKGALDWSYTGGAKSVENGKWYAVSKGALNWNFNGKLSCLDGKIRTFKKGAAL